MPRNEASMVLKAPAAGTMWSRPDLVSSLRIFEDEAEKMNLSIMDQGYSLLLVSQFTLYGDVRKGKRPGFNLSAPPKIAEEWYQKAILAFQEKGIPVEVGEFGADMKVSLENDGPVTIQLDSQKIY